MILVDWVQILLVSTAVNTHQRKQDRDLEILEEKIEADLEGYRETTAIHR